MLISFPHCTWIPSHARDQLQGCVVIVPPITPDVGIRLLFSITVQTTLSRNLTTKTYRRHPNCVSTPCVTMAASERAWQTPRSEWSGAAKDDVTSRFHDDRCHVASIKAEGGPADWAHGQEKHRPRGKRQDGYRPYWRRRVNRCLSEMNLLGNESCFARLNVHQCFLF